VILLILLDIRVLERSEIVLKVLGWIDFGNMDAIFYTFLGHNSEN
jgi:hypothetical protein